MRASPEDQPQRNNIMQFKTKLGLVDIPNAEVLAAASAILGREIEDANDLIDFEQGWDRGTAFPTNLPASRTVFPKNDMNDTDLITVCDRCLCATCWQGEFMCDEAQTAGTVKKPRAELVALGREHPSYLLTDAEIASLPTGTQQNGLRG
jgi:hypothetical protein